MKKVPTNLPASVRRRLLNLASDKQRDFGLVLTQHGLERLLYRLSVSRHREALVLKGALLLQLWIADAYRPTRDLDLLGVGEGSAERFHKLFADVCSQKVEDDGLSFLPETIRVERIRNDEEYEGVRVLLEARLASSRIGLQIDIGFGDAITPAATKVEYPTLLPFPAPKFWAYPKETVVAEEFEAMVKLGMANSRMKDFLRSLGAGAPIRVPRLASGGRLASHLWQAGNGVACLEAAGVNVGVFRVSRQANAVAGLPPQGRVRSRRVAA